MAKNKARNATKSYKGKTPSDTRALKQAPAEGLAPFMNDPSLLPKRPPGMQ